MEALQIKDFLNYRFLSAVKYSPDGKKAAFVVSQCNEEDNGYESRLWLWDGAALRQLTDLGKEKSFVWEDDAHILFPAVRSAAEKKRAESKDPFTAYYRLDLRGGEALPAFTLPFPARKLLPLGDGRWAVTGTIDANCPDYYAMSKEDKETRRKELAEEADYEVFDELPFWANGGGVTNKKRTALFLVDAVKGEQKRLTSPLFDVESVVLHSGAVWFTGVEQPAAHTRKSYLYRMDPATGAIAGVITQTDLFFRGIQSVGGRLVVAATVGKDHGLNENANLYLLNEADGTLELLRHEEYSMYSSVGSDCRYGGGEPSLPCGDVLYHTTTREGDSHLYRVALDGSSTPVVAETGSIDAFAVCPENDAILLIAMYGGRLQELYRVNKDGTGLTQLSHFNDPALEGKYVAQYQPVSVKSAGFDIHGWVLLPKDFDPAKQYPAVLDIHGGPKTAFGQTFYHEMQVWAGMGYFVFFTNPKGSDGRDNTFMDIRGEYGVIDYQNLMDFTDAVLAAWPQIDPARLCVTGGSYGGFMTNWIIGHTDRFCCAATQRSISNWISFWGVSDIGTFFGEDQTAGDPFTAMEKMWEQSPLKYAPNVKTPTLFIHSDEDYRCPLEQGLQLYSALVNKGVEARMCLFHGENHELSRSGKPKHRIRRLTEITNWFEKFAK